MRETVIELQSPLAADPATAWGRATSLAGIAAELPWPLRLTTHPPVDSLEEFVAASAVVAVLRVGPVPVLRWHPGIVELGDRRFVESSDDMTFMTGWRHERTVAAGTDGGSIVHDRITFTPRVPGIAPLVRWLFRRRHASLRRG